MNFIIAIESCPLKPLEFFLFMLLKLLIRMYCLYIEPFMLLLTSPNCLISITQSEEYIICITWVECTFVTLYALPSCANTRLANLCSVRLASSGDLFR